MIKPRSITFVSLDTLFLDRENPRLPTGVERSQQAMLEYLAETASIDELISSIGEHGYFPGEPLIVVPKDEAQSNNKWTVVEGNRRLVALKILQNPDLVPALPARLKNLTVNPRHKSHTIPVVILDKRDDALSYLGYRHITGIKEWPPLAKARYMQQIFERTSAETEVNDRYREVANVIGSRRDHVKRSLSALSVYRQVEENDFYNIGGLNEESIKFAVFSTALADTRIGSFIGLSNGDEDGTIEGLNSDHVRELVEWLFKPDSQFGGKAKVAESRDIRKLSAVVENQVALKSLRQGATLQFAWQQTEGFRKEFMHLLFQADTALTVAAGLVATIDFDEDALEIARRIRENIKLIGGNLADKQKRDEDDF